MGDLVAAVGMLVALVAGWRVVAARLKARGMHWLPRHLVASIAAAMAMFGWFGLILGLGLMAPSEDEPASFSLAMVIVGGMFLAPVVWSFLSGRGKGTATSPLPWLSRQLKQGADDIRENYRKEMQKQRERQKPLTVQRDVPADQLRFVYEDATGNVTTREVSDWVDDGEYLEGYCHLAGDFRTFRRDRIIEFVEGEHLLGSIIETDERPVRYVRDNDDSLEIAFTGFASDKKRALEAKAKGADMKVRAGVTKHLEFLVAGPNAGPTKLSRARAQGCTIMNEKQFHSLIDNGELPSALSAAG
jgi:hypothetical protein